MHNQFGVGEGVGVGEGEGVAVGQSVHVALGLGVAVAVGVAVAIGVQLKVFVGVGLAVALVVAVGVGVGSAAAVVESRLTNRNTPPRKATPTIANASFFISPFPFSLRVYQLHFNVVSIHVFVQRIMYEEHVHVAAAVDVVV